MDREVCPAFTERGVQGQPEARAKALRSTGGKPRRRLCPGGRAEEKREPSARKIPKASVKKR